MIVGATARDDGAARVLLGEDLAVGSSLRAMVQPGEETEVADPHQLLDAEMIATDHGVRGHELFG